MYNELNLLLFQVEDELFRFGKDSSVYICFDETTGQYIDHCVINDRSRSAPNIILQQMYGWKLHQDDLGNLHAAILDEMASR